MKQALLFRVCLVLVLVSLIPTLVFAMTSTNYGIAWDSLNEGGLDVSTSVNYGLRDTIGEVGTGESTSTNYQISAGYRAGEGTQSYISFRIRNSSDTDDATGCALGVLTSSAIGSCSYRLRIETNAENGFTAYMQTSGGLISGTSTLASIGNDSGFVAGTESYGLSSLVGATAGGVSGGVADQPVVEASAVQDASLTFDTDATPIGFTSATTVFSYNGAFLPATAPSLNTTSLITHAAAVSSSTQVGTYNQTVTYRVTGSF